MRPHIQSMREKQPTRRDDPLVPKGEVRDEIAAFVKKVGQLARPNAGEDGRLLFAVDATMSRQPTWDMAISLQAGMFEAIPKDAGRRIDAPEPNNCSF